MSTTTKRIEVLEDLPANLGGHKKGALVEDVPEATADLYISLGKAKAAPIAAGTDGAASLDTITSGILQLIAGNIQSQLDTQTKSVDRPSVLSQLGDLGRHATAKDPWALNEFFWAVGQTTHTMTGTPEQSKAIGLLTNKYKARRSESFGKDWESAQKAQYAGGQIIEKASVQNETTGALGGFGVPVQFYPEIIKLAYEESYLFRSVRKYPMVGLQMNIPAIDYTTATAGQSPYLGGMVAQWFAEGGGFTQTNIKIRQLELKANILGGYTQATRTLLADNAIGLQAILTEMMGMTISFYVTKSIVSGTGAAQPMGILNAAASIAVARTGDSTDGTTLADFANMKAKLLPGSEKRAFWMISPSMSAYLTQMNDKSGKVVYLPNFPSNQGGPASYPGNMAVLGLPVEVNQYASSQGTLGDIILVDPMAYAWGERQDLEIGVSEHVAFLSNELTWRFLFRGDGNSKINTYLTLANGDTVSPFVYRNT